MTGLSVHINVRIRDADWVSESAQCTTTSWADHSPGFGRHCSASAGTLASAARSRRGPSAYWSMRRARSSRAIMVSLLLGLRPAGEGAFELLQVVVVVRRHQRGPVVERDGSKRRMLAAPRPLGRFEAGKEIERVLAPTSERRERLTGIRA